MGIYIHIPFCLHKCNYCDFYSRAVNDPDLMERYTRSVINELRLRRNEISRSFSTIYLGGGTPSLLKTVQIEKILAAVFAYYQARDEAEISMEINPATVNLQDLKDLRSAGVNRISIGVQSFSDTELKILGRMHSGRDAATVLNDVTQAGFDNFNLDLIYGLPGQTMSAWRDNLKLAVDFNPQHISAYLLQLDPATPLARDIEAGVFNCLDDEEEARLYYFTLDYLQDYGYQHYEISNFARPDRECRHNLLYWQSRPYLGIGSGAVSFNGGQRILNQPPLDRYVEDLLDYRRPPAKILEDMDSRQKINDAVIMGLRLCSGISREDFLYRFGIDILREYQDIINACQNRGLLELKNDRISLTKNAYFLSNQVLCQFIN